MRCAGRTFHRPYLTKALRYLGRGDNALARSEQPETLLRNRLLEISQYLRRVGIAGELCLRMREIAAQLLITLLIELERIAVEVDRDHLLHD